MDIVISRPDWNDLFEFMLGAEALARGDETLAFLLTTPNRGPGGDAMVVRDILKPAAADYLHRSAGGIQPSGEFVASALGICRKNDFGLIEVHTHPFDNSSATTFSGIDWANDRPKMKRLASFMPETFQHATMVLGRQSFDAHYYRRSSARIEPVNRVLVVGGSRGERVVTTMTPTSVHEPSVEEIRPEHERHARFIGAEGVSALRRARVAVVGVGGIGALAAIELIHLGVGNLRLVDPDVVEQSNLNRLIGAASDDVGRPKVDVLARYAARVSGGTQVTTLQMSIDSAEGVDAVKGADLILGCLDNHGGRLVLNQLAVQYVIPLLDAGTGISWAGGAMRVGGQVQLVAPSRGCLLCRGFIDSRRAAFDRASTEQQAYERSHGYGTEEPAPSVVSLNAVIASTQVTMALRLLAQDGLVEDLVIYDAATSRMTPVQALGSSDCAVCSRDGLVGYGDLLKIERSAAAAVPITIPDARP